MNASAFAQALVKKCERALTSARTDLREGDTDSAVNRAYYAMFNVARAALLSAGIPENKLPRTHSGLIAAFGKEAVKIRHLDPELGRALSKTESLRLRADYTGAQIDLPTAERTVARAEEFVHTVERAFDLGALQKQMDLGADAAENASSGMETATSKDRGEASNSPAPWVSLEEKRLKAVENWRRTYHDNRGKEQEAQPEAADAKERSDNEKTHPEKDGGLEFDPDR